MTLKHAIELIHKNNYKVDYLGLYQNKTSSIHYFKKDQSPSDIRSLSKTIMTLVCGIVIEKEGLSLDEYVYPIIQNHIQLKNKDNLKHLQQIQIKHCLNHTLGYDEVLMMRQDIQNFKDLEFLNYLINKPLVYKPGEHYLYSNAGFYLLSVVLEHYLNQPLETYIQTHLFTPLNIQTYKWQKYGPYLAGATRLWLKPLDLMKFGQILLNDGLYQDTQIVSKSWLEFMKTPTCLTPNQDTQGHLLRRYAYGQGLWLAKQKHIFFGHGTDSQMLIIDQEKKMILLSQANHPRTKDIEYILNKIIECAD